MRKKAEEGRIVVRLHALVTPLTRALQRVHHQSTHVERGSSRPFASQKVKQRRLLHRARIKSSVEEGRSR
jgi:hypothetical protein